MKNERKEELKDGMKNRISLALKDPILQQGFEIICKENAELKADNDARKFAMTMSEKVEKQLREKNAELKHTTATLRQEKDNSNAHAKAMEIVAKTRIDQLTKAKNILKYVLNSFVGDLPKNLGYFDEEELKAMAEAENFLKESEVEK